MSTHSSMLCAWAMSPGPQTTAGTPPWLRRNLASVVKVMPIVGGTAPVALARRSPDEFGERVLSAHFAALAVIVYFDLVVDPRSPAASIRCRRLAMASSRLVPGSRRRSKPTRASSATMLTALPPWSVPMFAVGPPQQGVLDFAEVGGVQCQHDLSRMLDGRYALPRAAAVTRPALYQDLTLQETPLGDRYGERGRFWHDAGVARKRPFSIRARVPSAPPRSSSATNWKTMSHGRS